MRIRLKDLELEGNTIQEIQAMIGEVRGLYSFMDERKKTRDAEAVVDEERQLRDAYKQATGKQFRMTDRFGDKTEIEVLREWAAMNPDKVKNGGEKKTEFVALD